jgi:hypothetical protein
MDVPRRTAKLLVYAGSIGLAITFLVCVFLSDVMHALRGWHCGRDCTLPAVWSFEQSRDVFVLWLGGVRSVLQIRAGLRLQVGHHERRGPLGAYLAVAVIECAILAAIGDLPPWALALDAGWPLAVFAITRSPSVRPLVWDWPSIQLPSARLL